MKGVFKVLIESSPLVKRERLKEMPIVKCSCGAKPHILDNYLSEDGRVGVGIVCPKCNKETHGRYCVIRHTNGGWSWINAETNVMREWALANRKHGKRIMSHARVNRW